MDIIRGWFTPRSTHPTAGVTLPVGSLTQQGWQAVRRLATWRPTVSSETLIVLASIAFSAFYNQSFWRVLFG